MRRASPNLSASSVASASTVARMRSGRASKSYGGPSFTQDTATSLDVVLSADAGGKGGGPHCIGSRQVMTWAHTLGSQDWIQGLGCLGL